MIQAVDGHRDRVFVNDADLAERFNPIRLASGVFTIQSFQRIGDRGNTRVFFPQLKQISDATFSTIDGFTDRTSYRVLSTIMLGLLTDLDQGTRNKCVNVFLTRNKVVHGERHTVSRDEGSTAISVVEKVLEDGSIQELLL